MDELYIMVVGTDCNAFVDKHSIFADLTPEERVQLVRALFEHLDDELTYIECQRYEKEG